MKSRTRKILSKIGAGLMLGLSLLNLGVAWGKKNAAQIPKRYRRLREKEHESLQLKNQKLAVIAETEARKAIAKEESQSIQQAQQSGFSTLSLGQKIFRYTVVAGWVIFSSVFFSSMVFNYPFAWGRGALSLLPGTPHTANLYLVPKKEMVKPGEAVEVKLILDAPHDQVAAVKAVLAYNPKEVYLVKYEKEESAVWREQLSENNGKVVILLEKKEQKGSLGERFNKKTLLALYFAPTTVQESKRINIKLDQNQSLVLVKKEGKQKNVLGKVGTGQFFVVNSN